MTKEMEALRAAEPDNEAFKILSKVILYITHNHLYVEEETAASVVQSSTRADCLTRTLTRGQLMSYGTQNN